MRIPDLPVFLVGRVRVERTSSDFQSGAPTLYATAPYIIWTSSTTPRSYASTVGVSFSISVFISLYFRFFYFWLGTDEIFVGLEPTTHCLPDNCSTKWAKIFSIENNCCVCLITQRKESHLWITLGCERVDSNHRPLAYEANELPTAPLRNGVRCWSRTSASRFMRPAT